ncbi:cyclase [Dictyobacter sp. S3.2.2.5]|uniref:Cyclase n=1 Tax=Dictyobacter halimunensis TaxID=3026934 RepID=A0ABQ6FNG1_9CHLR|nr:cyclase [Dictyobacter sp. S3.2.2.5]
MDSLLQSALNAQVYDLEQPRYFGAPILPSHAPGFVYTLHRRHEPGLGEARTGASGHIYMAEHAGTHIDALTHQAENLRLYGGREVNAHVQTSTGFTEMGVDTIAPIVCRGVLLDVAKYQGVDVIAPDQHVTRADLEATASQQKVTIREGDVVLVRTGNGARWKDPEVYLASAGIRGDASQWLADQKVRAVGADNVAWDVLNEVDPELHVTLPGHIILLVRHGIHILENVFLEDLARDQRHEFLFVCLPLKIQGGTGSPIRPIAIAS